MGALLCQVLRRRLQWFERLIQSGAGMPSRSRPENSAPNQLAAAPRSSAVASENARMIVLARVREMAFLESAMTVSTRRSASLPVRPVVLVIN